MCYELLQNLMGGEKLTHQPDYPRSEIGHLILFDRGTHKPPYNTVHYNTVLVITQLKDRSQKICRLYRKITIYGHFCVQSIHFCLTNMVSAFGIQQ